MLHLFVCFGLFGKRGIEGAFQNVELLDQELKFSFLCNLLGWSKGV